MALDQAPSPMTYTSSTVAVPEVCDVPRHIAIILDGNGRWARQRMMARTAGHIRGTAAVRAVVEACVERGVEYLTLFAFSSENWRRPSEEVSVLMRLFMVMLKREINRMQNNNVRLKVVGDLSMFDRRVQELASDAQRKTASNTGLTLTIAANYGGRWDILQAAQALAKEAAESGHAVLIDEKAFSDRLALAYAPEPDLFIRTGGEQRVSNFLLWQLAYTELYFTDTFWPDFNAEALDLAIESYRRRERRFGRTSAQLAQLIKKASSLSC